MPGECAALQGCSERLPYLMGERNHQDISFSLVQFFSLLDFINFIYCLHVNLTSINFICSSKADI